MSKCPRCGVEVDDGAKFCMECGEAIPQTKECPKCQAQWPLNAKFCRECGYNFSAAPAAAGAPLMGDKNVIAGDVNNSVSMSNSNNTTNVTTNNTTNSTTNNVSNVSSVTNNSQVTNNSTTNNTYIKQEVKQETELDKEAKRVQIEKLRIEKEHEQEAKRVELERLRLEKEQKENELARQSVLAEAALEAEKTRKAAELAKEKMRLKEIEEEANKSPYSKKTFRKLGLWGGFLGLHYAYVRRWPLFGVTVALIAAMSIFGKHPDPKADEAATTKVELTSTMAESSSDKPAKSDPVTMVLGLGMMVLWFGGAFFITTDAKGRKLM